MKALMLKKWSNDIMDAEIPLTSSCHSLSRYLMVKESGLYIYVLAAVMYIK
jgi:hypothetical protein